MSAIDSKMKGTFGGVLLGVIMLLVAFNVSGQTVDVSAFGMYDDLSAQESSISGAEYQNGTLQLTDATTSGTWTSVNHSIENATELHSYVAQLDSNNSVSVTVTGYDDSGTETGTASATYDSSESGLQSLDLSSLGDSTSQVEVQYDLSRDSTSDEKPQLTAYEGYGEGQTPYIKYIVAVFGIVVMLFSLRNM